MRVLGLDLKTTIHLDWIDTATDLPSPASLLHIFAYYSIEDILRLKESSLPRVVAQEAYENRDQARSEGFRWDPKNRTWYIEGKKIVLKERRFPFPKVWL